VYSGNSCVSVIKAVDFYHGSRGLMTPRAYQVTGFHQKGHPAKIALLL